MDIIVFKDVSYDDIRGKVIIKAGQEFDDVELYDGFYTKTIKDITIYIPEDSCKVIKEEYLMVTKKHNGWIDGAVLFWGKNYNGYVHQISDIGIYSKDDSYYRCKSGGFSSVPVPIKFFNVTRELLEENKSLGTYLKYTDELNEYIDKFLKDNKK